MTLIPPIPNDGSAIADERMICNEGEWFFVVRQEPEHVAGESQTHKSHVVVPEREPTEQEVVRLIEHLHVYPELPRGGVRAAVEVPELDEGVDGGEKGPVQPSTSLGYELGQLVGDVSDGVGGFNVVQGPRASALGDQLPAEDTIFGQVHVCREDICICAMLRGEEVRLVRERVRSVV